MKQRKVLLVCMILFFCISLTGCWDYIGLDEMALVTGVAIDRSPDGESYILTAEMVNTDTSGGDAEIKVIYVEMEGDTVFSALRNGKRRLSDKLYGGHMQTLIISHELAETEGVLAILEELFRDNEPRETLSIVISEEESARELFFVQSIDTEIVSYEIHESLMEDDEVTASTINTEMYEAYNAIKAPYRTLVLPRVRTNHNLDKLTAESNGAVYFEGDVAKGTLTPDQMKYYLFFKDLIRGGSLSFLITNDLSTPVSLEIKQNKTKLDFKIEDGRLIVLADVNTHVNLMQQGLGVDYESKEERQLTEQLTATFIADQMQDLYKTAQEEIGLDILEIENMIRKKDLNTWRAYEGQWAQLIAASELRVTAVAEISNTGVLKNY